MDVLCGRLVCGRAKKSITLSVTRYIWFKEIKNFQCVFISGKTECFLFCKMNHPLPASMKPWSAATAGERALECKCESLKQEESFKGRDQERDIQARKKKERLGVRQE